MVQGTDNVGPQPATADHAVGLQALRKTRSGFEVTPVIERIDEFNKFLKRELGTFLGIANVHLSVMDISKCGISAKLIC